MYGVQKILAKPDPVISAPSRIRHVTFVERAELRKRPLDLSPIREDAAPMGPVPAPIVLTGEGDVFLRWLFRQANLDMGQYGPQTLARRMPACLRLLRAQTPGQAQQFLKNEPLLIPQALGMLLIGVTSFFRDSAVFEQIQKRVIPDVSQSRGGIRVWSNGCSEGHELYSVAMLLAEAGLLGRCELLGTDCRIDALERARDGEYDDVAVKDLSVRRRQQFMVRHDANQWQVVSSLRKRIQWRRGDATSIVEPGQWDIILCRNMAMYFRSGTSVQLWQHLERALRNGGYLITGKAERPSGTSRLVAVAPCVYRREWA